MAESVTAHEVNREAVRVLAQAIGVRAAAREMGIPEATVQAWSAKGKWMIGEQKRSRVYTVATTKAQPGVVNPADAMANVLENLSENTRLGFARASAKVAEKLSTSDVDELLGEKRAAAAHTWAKTAALAHGWSGGAGTTVNVAVALRMDME
jgi:hypothetical protein